MLASTPLCPITCLRSAGALPPKAPNPRLLPPRDARNPYVTRAKTYMIGQNQTASTTANFFKNAQFYTSVPNYMLGIKKSLRNVRIRSIPACDYFYCLSEVWNEACRRHSAQLHVCDRPQPCVEELEIHDSSLPDMHEILTSPGPKRT